MQESRHRISHVREGQTDNSSKMWNHNKRKEKKVDHVIMTAKYDPCHFYTELPVSDYYLFGDKSIQIFIILYCPAIIHFINQSDRSYHTQSSPQFCLPRSPKYNMYLIRSGNSQPINHLMLYMNQSNQDKNENTDSWEHRSEQHRNAKQRKERKQPGYSSPK